MSEKTAEAAQKMIQDLLLAGFSGVKISKGTGVNQITIGNLKNGKNARVTETVYDKIWDFWSENVPSKDVLEKLRAEKASSKSAQSAPNKAESSGSSKNASSKPKRKYTRRSGEKSSAKTSFPGTEGFINRNYVPVDLTALHATIDNLISRFSDSLKELEAIRKQIK
jgi:hypothetical protein